MGELLSLNPIFSTEPVYFPISLKSKLSYSGSIPGIENILWQTPCLLPYVFHAMISYPQGDILQSRKLRGLNPNTIGHEGHVFSYTVPKNNITAYNNIELPERKEMKEILGDDFYNLVFTNRYGIQRVIRLGSLLKTGYLAVLEGFGFQRILRCRSEGGAKSYFVYQAVKPKEAQIVDVVEIAEQTAHRIYGFYHLPEFEYIPGLVGTIPLEQYLSKCSSRMRRTLSTMGSIIFEEQPFPLPDKLTKYVIDNRKINLAESHNN